MEPLSDSVSDSADRYEAGLVFMERGVSHLGLGNAYQAWGYSAFNATQPDTRNHGAGEIDFRSILAESSKENSFEYPRLGVRRTLVARIDFVPGDADRITVWMHPSLRAGTREEDLPRALTTEFRADTSFDEIRLVHRGGGSGWLMGDLKVATYFEDLTEPYAWQSLQFIGGVTLGIAALIGMAGWWRTTRTLRRERGVLEVNKALERERDRIARDLHDSLGATLSEISLLSSMAEIRPPVEVAQDVVRIQKRAQEAAEALEAIVWAADGKSDTVPRFVEYALNFAKEFLSVASIRLTVESELSATAQNRDAPMATHVRHNAFLAFKEALNNVVKHAQASEVTLRFVSSPQRLVIEVCDNGLGNCPKVKPDGASGRGLRNMRSRLESVGGNLSVESPPLRGTRIRFELPLEAKP